MRTLILGANGFVGSAFVDQARKRWGSAYGIQRAEVGNEKDFFRSDYSPNSLADIFSEVRPDLLILAAGSAKVADSVASPSHDRENSLQVIEKILEGLRITSLAPNIFFTSTAAVYGNPAILPVTEDSPKMPVSSYGENRLACEKLLFSFARGRSIKIVSGRAFSLFGKNQRQMVLWEIALQALTKSEIVIQGSGLETRDYISVDEFAGRALNVMIRAPGGNHDVNIASGSRISILELATVIKNILGLDLPIRTLNQDRAWNPSHWHASIEKYINLTGDDHPFAFMPSLSECLHFWRDSIRNPSDDPRTDAKSASAEQPHRQI